MDLDRVPGGLAGQVGDVRITRADARARGPRLRDLRVTIDEADVAMLDLARGKAEVGWDELRLSGRHLARRRSAATSCRGWPPPACPDAEALQIRVVPQPGGHLRAACRASRRCACWRGWWARTASRLEVQGSGAAARVLREALPDAIDVGPLPLHIKLTGIRYGQGVVYVEGRRGPGSDTFD